MVSFSKLMDITMKLVRWILGAGCIALSFLFLMPPVPSEPVPLQRLEIVNRAVVESMIIYFVGLMLLRERYVLFQFRRFSRTAVYLLIFGVCFSLHCALRACLWIIEHQDTYGHPLYNIFVHSLVYSLMMCCILFVTTWRKHK